MQSIQLKGTEKILVTRTDRIGDVVLSTPVFSAIKKRYPKAHLAVMVFKETAPVVLGNPSVDEVIVYDKKGVHRSWLRTLAFGIGLRRKKFEVVIHLHPTNRANIISWLARIPVRIGYEVKRGRHGRNHFLLTHVIEEKKWQGKRHEADYNFDLLSFVDVPRPEEFELYFPLVSAGRERLNEQLPKPFNSHYVVFHPSASCPSKRWSPEQLGKVADSLAAAHKVLPIIIGEGEGVLHARQMEESMKEKAVNLSGQLDLSMLGWLLKGARLLISNDSGPVHIAAALKTPVISIFGRSQLGLGPVRWKPISVNSSFLQKDVGCGECLAHLCEIDFKCLKELKAEEVLEEARKYEAFLA